MANKHLATMKIPKLILTTLTLICAVVTMAASDDTTSVVYRLPIFSNINSTTWIHTQRGFEEAEEINAEAILVHLNTYGGEVVFADSIRTKILNSRIPVYVFIDNNAASAGALISIAAKKIYMRPGSNIGAATVVNATGEAAPDKYQSYMRATIRATAEAHGMDTIVSGNDTIVKWKRDPRIAEAMVDERVIIPGISEEGQVLTFTAKEAFENGYCDAIVSSVDEVKEQIGLSDAKVVSFKPSFYDNVKGFLTSPVLSGILILLIIGGIYFEMQSPGIGFPLVVAICAAVLYFAPLYLDGLAENWEILIFIIGIALIALEIFVIPGFGVAGISGIILTITGLTLSLVDNVIFDFSGVHPEKFFTALLTVILSLAGGVILAIYLSNKLVGSKTGPFARIALHTSQEIDKGYVGVDTSISHLVGRTGEAVTDLRPAGTVMIDGELYDARATEGFIEKGEIVKAIKYQYGQLNVRRVSKQ
mgnify:FL=1